MTLNYCNIDPSSNVKKGFTNYLTRHFSMHGPLETHYDLVGDKPQVNFTFGNLSC
jgi:hypothetical protein